MSLEPSLKVNAQEFVAVQLKTTVTSVLSSAIKDLVLAVIGRAESNLSKSCMRRLSELTRENEQANKHAHILRHNQRVAEILSSSRSISQSL